MADAEQTAFLEKQNRFRESHVESSAPGQVLWTGTFVVGSRKGVGTVCLHVVVDTTVVFASHLALPGQRRKRTVADPRRTAS